MTTEYRIRLDRGACDGVFACLVRDDRFVEAADGLATIEGGRDDSDGEEGVEGVGGAETAEEGDGTDELVVTFDDGRLAAARGAARACPLDAIDVSAGDDDE